MHGGCSPLTCTVSLANFLEISTSSDRCFKTYLHYRYFCRAYFFLNVRIYFPAQQSDCFMTCKMHLTFGDAALDSIRVRENLQRVLDNPVLVPTDHSEAFVKIPCGKIKSQDMCFANEKCDGIFTPLHFGRKKIA